MGVRESLRAKKQFAWGRRASSYRKARSSYPAGNPGFYVVCCANGASAHLMACHHCSALIPVVNALKPLPKWSSNTSKRPFNYHRCEEGDGGIKAGIPSGDVAVVVPRTGAGDGRAKWFPCLAEKRKPNSAEAYFYVLPKLEADDDDDDDDGDDDDDDDGDDDDHDHHEDHGHHDGHDDDDQRGERRESRPYRNATVAASSSAGGGTPAGDPALALVKAAEALDARVEGRMADYCELNPSRLLLMHRFVQLFGEDASCVLAHGKLELRRLPDLHGARSLLHLIPDKMKWLMIPTTALKIPSCQRIFVMAVLPCIRTSGPVIAVRGGLNAANAHFNSMTNTEKEYWRALLFLGRFHHGPTKMVGNLKDATIQFMAGSPELERCLQRAIVAAADEQAALDAQDWVALRSIHQEQSSIHDDIVDVLHAKRGRGNALAWFSGDYNLAFTAARALVVMGCRGKLIDSSTSWGSRQASDTSSWTEEERQMCKPLGPLEAQDKIKAMFDSVADAALVLPNNATLLSFNIAFCFLYSASSKLITAMGSSTKKAHRWLNDTTNVSRVRSLLSFDDADETRPVFSLPLAVLVVIGNSQMKIRFETLRLSTTTTTATTATAVSTTTTTTTTSSPATHMPAAASNRGSTSSTSR